MGKQPWRIVFHPSEPFHAAPLVPRQRLVLASGPVLKPLINVSRELSHPSLIERTIVVPPPSYRRVVLLRQFGQRRRRLARNAPASHHLPHALHRIRAHTRQETRKYPMLIAHGFPWPESKTKKGEMHMRKDFSTIAVLAIHDL